MVGLGQIALDSAPVFGGVMLAVAAGQFKGPDYRGMIKQDMDLLDRLPRTPPTGVPICSGPSTPASTTWSRPPTAAARCAGPHCPTRATGETWCCCSAVLFTIVWWNVSHARSSWLPMFILLIVLSSVAAAYAFRGVLRAASAFARKRRGRPD